MICIVIYDLNKNQLIKLYKNKKQQMRPKSSKQRRRHDEEFDDLAYRYRNHLDLSKMIDKPQVKTHTQYKSAFRPKTHSKDQVRPYEQKIKEKEIIISKTQYTNTFKGEKPINSKDYKIPFDNLVINKSPAANLSCYKSQFPGHRGLNQYIKVKNEKFKDFTRTDFRTTYATSFQDIKRSNESKGDSLSLKSSSFSKTTKWDKKISASTCKSSYSIDFKKIKNSGKEQNEKKLNFVDPEININLNQSPNRPQSSKKTYQDFYSTKPIFQNLTRTNNNRTKTMYEVEFAERPDSFVRPGKKMQMMKLKKYQEKQLSQLRQKMKTCYC